MFDRQTLLKFIRSPHYRPLKRSELAHKLKIAKHRQQSFFHLLKQMVEEGVLVKVKSNRFALPSQVDLTLGTLQAHEKGFGFVIPAKEGTPDIFIAPHNMHTALHGDRVWVRLIEKKFQRYGKRKKTGTTSLDGKIIEVESRSSEPLVGALAKTEKFHYVIPENPRISRDIYVDKNELKGAKLGDKVVVELTSWESNNVNPEGKITEVLGSPDTPWMDLQLIMRRYNLSESFPQKVKTEYQHIPDEVQKKDLENRTDFRGEVVLTIDPDDAKDFDDAISLDKLPNGNWKLGIYIADASHYVQPNTCLNEEAYQRGTSVYFPGKVIPMLPEKLSNNLCSLKQDKTRLVKSVCAELNPDGVVQNYTIHNGIIKSRKRYNYQQVFQIVSDREPNLRKANADTVPTLDRMKELALVLQKRRLNRGSLQLDIPAVKIRVDEKGRVKSIEKEEQDIAHTMIEEFMLIANEMVATHLSKRGLSCIYRVHAKPSEEGLMDFIHLVKSFGFKIPPVTTTQKIQQFLDSISSHPDAPAINYHLLRSLNRAEYSSKNIGHYALALNYYAHFTSPIRRYPDLLVHRLLNQVIEPKGASTKVDPALLAGMAKHCSLRERVAQEAEYNAIDLKKLEFLQDQIKKKKHRQLKGIIRSIMPHGFFVETTDFLIDGFVSASSLTDDFYSSDAKKHKMIGKRTGKSFKLGQLVIVEPIRIDLVKRQADFKIISKHSR